MTIAEKMESMCILRENAKKIEELLTIEQSKIEEEKWSCSHITVDLGYYGYYPRPGSYCRCLICGKGKIPEYYYRTYSGLKDIVYAGDYLPQYDITDPDQCEEKFERIQALAYGILKENPNIISTEELTAKLNGVIQESASSKNNKGAPKEFVKTAK